VNMACRTWLPTGASGGAAIERLLAETCRAWSDHWFARRLMRCEDAANPCDPVELGRLRALDLRFVDEGLGLAPEPGATAAIAGMMLDEPVHGHPKTQADEELIGRLAEACLDDLGLRLTKAFGLPRASPWRRGEADPYLFREARVAALGASASEPLIRILVAPDLVAELIKSAAGSAGTTAPLQPLGVALAKQRIGLSARVGECSLTLSEFAGLAAGDVLVLDTLLEASLPLAVDGTVRSGGCTVEQEEAQLCLKIVQPPVGTPK
jgi:hypothetical protein